MKSWAMRIRRKWTSGPHWRFAVGPEESNLMNSIRNPKRWETFGRRNLDWGNTVGINANDHKLNLIVYNWRRKQMKVLENKRSSQHVSLATQKGYANLEISMILIIIHLAGGLGHSSGRKAALLLMSVLFVFHSKLRVWLKIYEGIQNPIRNVSLMLSWSQKSTATPTGLRIINASI